MNTLNTKRLLLRPITKADAGDLERVVFEDPEVVKGLAHDGSNPEVRRSFSESWSEFGPDGNYDFWDQCNIGLYVITDSSGQIASRNEFMGITGVFMEKENDKWEGEFFYALGSSFHGKGVMSEACNAVISHFKSIPNASSLYAVYWQILNPASGKILSKMNFQNEGTQLLLNEYDIEKVLGIRCFELWRLGNYTGANPSTVVEEVAVKLGHFESEGISNRADNVADILNAIPDPEAVPNLNGLVESSLDTGKSSPPFTMMRLYV